MSYAAKVAEALDKGDAKRVSRTLLGTGKYEVVVVTGDGRKVGTGDTDEAALDAALEADAVSEPVDVGEAEPKPHARAAHKASADKE